MMTRIVVGVDGSDHSSRALLRAVEEGRLRHGTVEAVYVYERPRRSLGEDLISLPLGTTAGLGRLPISPDGPAHDPPAAEIRAHDIAEARLERFVRDVVGDGDGGPKPHLVVIEGDQPAEALIEHAADADLLVIGTRGHGGFTGMLLGSVAHQCIQHCRCPMLILPPAEK
jgi:nucleotide-binding universal stress UspA family protein